MLMLCWAKRWTTLCRIMELYAVPYLYKIFNFLLTNVRKVVWSLFPERIVKFLQALMLRLPSVTAWRTVSPPIRHAGRRKNEPNLIVLFLLYVVRMLECCFQTPCVIQISVSQCSSDNVVTPRPQRMGSQSLTLTGAALLRCGDALSSLNWRQNYNSFS
jgi:hypothetical protein